MFLGINNVYVHPKYVRDYEKLLAGGIWCIVDLTYFFDEDEKGKSPFMINDITPIQMPNLDKNEIIEGRKTFQKRNGLIYYFVRREWSQHSSNIV